MQPQIEEARKRIAACRERGDSDLWISEASDLTAALNVLLPIS